VIDFHEYDPSRDNDSGRRDRVNFYDPTRIDSMEDACTESKQEELVHYFTATTKVIQQEKPRQDYLVTTVE
jgi:hypothetical protein